ncbi:hypothetical protein N657DRAFT_629576 [Parathielavia appendiculata]|uniref:Heterokaryon incompatibility domain-containing protein n=1 Tax=Parathielavia appendiculata TaxID=2587402 RepID=A0AAN6U8M7_9PEZI|nr:hypothetical protein N657DRAFT_629576 [Parathielavia appendiculata]
MGVHKTTRSPLAQRASQEQGLPLEETEVPAFIYRPLEDAGLETRFFKLFLGDFDEPGRIGHDIEYDAIPWCWEEDPSRTTMFLRIDEGLTRCLVSKGLEATFRHLRRRWRDRVVWADALCINQTDISERNLQASNMAPIYNNAANICVWLSQDTPDSKLAMRFIQDELCDIERAQWFSRLWIIQEILFARKATLHCGRDELSWSQFATAIELLLETEKTSQRFSSVMKMRPDFWDGSSLFAHVNQSGAGLLGQGILFRDYKTKSASQGPLWRIEHLVSSLTVVFDTTEPRHCIYALLGVVADVTPSPDVKDEPRLLRPWRLSEVELKTARYLIVYSKPYPEICMNFVEFCIDHSPHRHWALDIICRPWAMEPVPKNFSTGERDHASEFLPSWVIEAPETSFRIMTHPLSRKKVTRQNADSLAAPPDTARTQYAASSNETFRRSTLTFRRRPNLRHYSMLVRGFVFDQIERVEASSQDGCIRRSEPSSPTGPNLRLHCPRSSGARSSSTGDATGRPPPIYLRGGVLAVCHQGGIQSRAFCKRVQASSLNRRLFKTSGGRSGLASKSVASGDLLCILPGCSVPVVFRRFSKAPGDSKAEKNEDKLQHSLGVFKRTLLDRIRAKEMREQWARQNRGVQPLYSKPQDPRMGQDGGKLGHEEGRQ